MFQLLLLSKKVQRHANQIRQYSQYWHSLIDVKPEVKEALDYNRPLVCLESTIITHGMPYPQNLETALQVENIVRQENAVPATIGIINGRIKVGLTDEQFEILAKQPSQVPTIKTSRRDFGHVLGKKLNGGTTVAGTTIIANLVGIKIFATGAIGGVHRAGENTMDVSADLTELGKTFIAVVSSGVKSILDIPRTLEYLETQGVAVASYRSSERDFPAFYTRKSGSKAPFNIQNPTEAANVISSMKAINLSSGILIAVPIPQEFAMDEEIINSAISTAIEEAKLAEISGKEATPFLLNAIGKITKGKSLGSNIALIKNNAKVAAQIAVELSKQKMPAADVSPPMTGNSVPVVIGGSVMDICYTAEQLLKLNGATYHTSQKCSAGGVGRNLAEGLFKLHGNVKLISKVGDDQNGKCLLDSLPEQCRDLIEIDTIAPTATCAVIFDSLGDSKLLLANMKIHETITPDMILRNEHTIAQAPVVVFDGNISIDTMGTILELCHKYKKPAFFEPTDLLIATKPFNLPPKLVNQIKFISPNIYELNAIAKYLNLPKIIDSTETSIDHLFESNSDLLFKITAATTEIMKYIDNIIVTLGPCGILMTTNRASGDMKIFSNKMSFNNLSYEVHNRFYGVDPVTDVVNVSGAGDSFNVGFISAMIRGYDESICVSVGLESARTALKSSSAVPFAYFKSNHPCWTQAADNKNI